MHVLIISNLLEEIRVHMKELTFLDYRRNMFIRVQYFTIPFHDVLHFIIALELEDEPEFELQNIHICL